MSHYLKSVEFAAGRFNYDAVTKKVTPDPSKGKILVYHNDEGEKHFKWINSATNTEDIDLFVFEFDARFTKVVQSKNRVYLLSFASNDDKFFFWLQEPDVDKDDTYCSQVNEVINYAEEEQEIEEEEEKAQPQPPPVSSQGQPSTAQKDWISALQETFKKLGGGAPRPENETPCLSEVLKSEFLTEVGEDKEFQAALIPLLPEGRQTLEELKEMLKSPQFLQALDSMDRAVNNESGASVLASLGLDQNLFYQNYDGSDALYKGVMKLMKK